MEGLLLPILGLGFLLCLSAFFSGSETALCALTRLQVERLRSDGRKSSRAVLAFLDDPRRLFITILLGNTFVNIAFATLTAALIYGLFGSGPSGPAIVTATLLITLLLLVFGEITPKTFAIRHAERFCGVTARPLWGFSIVIYPLRKILRAVTDLLLPLFGGGDLPSEDHITSEDFRAILDAHDPDHTLQPDEREILGRILELGEIESREIMVPRTEMVAMSTAATMREVLDRARKVGFSRIPLYTGRIDNVSGVLLVKDWVRWRDLETTLAPMTIDRFLAERGGLPGADSRAPLVHAPFFTPESRTIASLLPELTRLRSKMAILVDEHGGVSGSLTTEDIVEEVVGDIVDEHDAVPFADEIVARADDPSVFDVDARVSVRHVNRRLGLRLDEDAADTIGGYVLSLFERIPKAGEAVVDARGARFEVRECDGRRIRALAITRPSGAPEAGS